MAHREPLSREKILDAALALAGEEGLDGLSMRKLAKSLGVEAMSLYNHVANKADILDGLAERAFAEVDCPDPALPWPDRVRAIASSMHRALSRHPVVPLALVTDQANPTSVTALRPLDALVGALFEAGFSDADARRMLTAVNSLIFGSLLLSTAGFTVEDFRAQTGEQQLDVFVRHLDPARLPHFSRLIQSMPDTDPETDFDRALDALISGLIATAPGSPPESPE
ncbi:TetR/AcrR family transcriptional regulator C-terminal domain-containing protein [Actinoallomurus purpureus]|uniref:TetR/AcrR family transcriptional regulator C-terminal domain-containing protein n=1 Tax=Actinoallomurus purpureus TaxID=478114 RepID=UPI002092206C|nr:TetR/AcrR family transcriptional regulator C-terminal domain-containing protein [Actinoallomurus purpureus]MCO6009296.1 TetR/AcrR family transcriptional regulator C-terminal domain-containing protein [Actinoallomurus purpureus]